MQTENYKHTVIMTATPMELIMMLYDEAIKSLAKAETAFKLEGPGKIQEINNNLIHAQDVITELAVSLDMDKGGEIAANLHRLYDFMLDHLTKANTLKKDTPVSEVKNLLVELRDSWKKVADQEPRRTGLASGMQTGKIVISG